MAFPSVRKFLRAGYSSQNEIEVKVPFGDTVEFSDFTDGPLPKYFYAPSWKIESGKTINTPELGSNFISNSDMENWSNDTTLTGWSNNGTGPVKDSANKKNGSFCARVDINSSNTGAGLYINPLQAVGTWSKSYVFTKSSVAGKTPKFTFQGATRIGSGSLEYEKLDLTGRAVGSSYFTLDRNSAASSSLFYDEAFSALINLPSLFATMNTNTSDIRFIVECSVSPGFQEGVVVNLDNPSNPLNFIIGYLSVWDGSQNLNLVQCLNGVYTSLISVTNSGATATEQNGAIEVRIVGNKAQLFYKSIQIDTDKTIDSSFASYTNHGFFSTDPKNSIRAFYVGDPTHVISIHSNAITAVVGIPDHSIVQEPTVMFEDGSFHMWYSQDNNANGRDIGYATSLNGETWTPYANNPVISGWTRCFVLKDGSDYVMYTGGATIERWTSSDKIHWTHTGRALSQGSAGSWDSDGLQNMFVFKDTDNLWKMFYESHGSKWWIGLAISEDNISWTKDPANPILGGGIASYSAPHVVKIEDIYYAWYHGNPSANLPTDIYCLKSTDLHNWKRCINNFYRRALTNEGPATANGQVADVNLVEVGGITYLYFTVSTDQVSFNINQAKALVPISLLVK